MKSTIKYPQLGNYLANARRGAGIIRQSVFASQLGVTQQTVSRWEKGGSRPKPDQIANIAKILNCDMKELNSAAGYEGNFPPQVTFDKTWPLDALTPDSFERFCTDFLARLYSEADVHRYGDQGHKQDGLDIEAIFHDETTHTFQCKRRASFGPKNIESAVKAHTRSATNSVIIISCLASPQAREEIKKHQKWKLWDREDVSRLIRFKLAKDDQVKLADIYFKTHRFVLTGEIEPSVWQTPDTFFSATLKPENSFIHTWNLVGREAEINSIWESIIAVDKTVIFIKGSGGSGKSKILLEISKRAEQKLPERRVLFLSGNSLTQKDIEALPKGPKLLICDDAHNRNDLIPLFSFASDLTQQTKLIVATRQYGMRLIQQQASNLTYEEVQEIELPRLSLADGVKLATQALQHYKGKLNLAERLATLTHDCPLATIIGAKVTSESNSHPEFLLNEDSFRYKLMNKFINTITKNVSSGLSQSNVDAVLKSIAIIQPISDNDSDSLDVLANISDVKSNELKQIIRRLKDAGVLFVRAETIRISPDLLGDFLVEDACIYNDNQSTGFAEKAFDVAPEIYTEHIMLNLGKLDWIKSNGDTRQSHILKNLWDKIGDDQNQRYSSMLARTPLAYYQPAQALNFVRGKIQTSNQNDYLPKIISNVAYDYRYLPQACELLWELGQQDNRPTNKTSEHPIRLLSELAAPNPTNSLKSIETVVEFAIGLIPFDHNWTSNHTPLTILASTLNTEGHTITSTPRTLAMQPYQISIAAMKTLRRSAIDASINLLFDSNISRGYIAAEFLQKALQLPIGIFDLAPTTEQNSQWLEELCETLNAIEKQLNERAINPIVYNQLAKAVSWHALHFDGITTAIANKILTHQKLDLDARTINMLMSNWESPITPVAAEDSIEQREKATNAFVEQLLTNYPDTNLLYNYLKNKLEEIEFASKGDSHFSWSLMAALMLSPRLSSVDFAKKLVQSEMFQTKSTMSEYVGIALSKLLNDAPEMAHLYIDKAFSTQNELAIRHVAISYSRFMPKNIFTEFDVEVIKKLVTSTNGSIVKISADAFRHLAFKDQATALKLIGMVNLGIDEAAANEHLMLLSSRSFPLFDKLTSDQIKTILKRLVPLPKIGSFWVGEFLCKELKQDASSVLQFFMQRIVYSLDQQNIGYWPIPFDYFQPHKFCISVLQSSNDILKGLFEQARKYSNDRQFCYHFAVLIKCVCAPYDAAFLHLIETSFNISDEVDLNLILRILEEAPRDLVFSNEDFVRRFLDKAKLFSTEVLERSIGAFFCCSVNGGKHGTQGEPYPQDISLRDSSREVLARIGKFEPAHRLYSDLLDLAEENIKREIRAGKRLDELEEL